MRYTMEMVVRAILLTAERIMLLQWLLGKTWAALAWITEIAMYLLRPPR